MHTSYSGCRALVRSPSASASSSVDGERSVSPSGTSRERQIGRRRVGEVVQPAGLGVALDVIPPVGHVVAGQEYLDVVAAIRPPVPDHPHVVGVVRVGLPPVAEQVVDDGVQPLLRRVPRLEQVVVEADVVDRLDRDVCVGVRREQQVFRVRCVGTLWDRHRPPGRPACSYDHPKPVPPPLGGDWTRDTSARECRRTVHDLGGTLLSLQTVAKSDISAALIPCCKIAAGRNTALTKAR